ncbi:hypothetical protein GCM10027160_23750 [Streptomyces calidiresistens]|nr:hypothetical protein [Streptomyces calidiresistens]
MRLTSRPTLTAAFVALTAVALLAGLYPAAVVTAGCAAISWATHRTR